MTRNKLLGNTLLVLVIGFCFIQLVSLASNLSDYLLFWPITAVDIHPDTAGKTLGEGSELASNEENIGDVITLPYGKGLIPDRISIPSINLTLPVRYVPLNEQGTWQVHEAVANYAAGTSYVNNERGNVGIFGHDRLNALHLVKDLVIGNEIRLKIDAYEAIYLVEEIFNTVPENVSVFDQTDTPIVTLVTCDGDFSKLRYVVRAKLEKITSRI
ncbi:sortase [Patescibacteria group bacterium]|nr:sortase [Patescibacteria group bacterium]MBU1868292.1 sortase [Patescibacteria group bacterium]